jgi:hypothetical protein
MNNTKDQIQQLAPEQQEALAFIVLKREATRQRLLKQRGKYRAMLWLPALVFLVLYLATMPNPVFGKLSGFCVAISLWFLIQFHASRLNRRLDALIELMEDDHDATQEGSSAKQTDKREQSRNPAHSLL